MAIIVIVTHKIKITCIKQLQFILEIFYVLSFIPSLTMCIYFPGL